MRPPVSLVLSARLHYGLGNTLAQTDEAKCPG